MTRPRRGAYITAMRSTCAGTGATCATASPRRDFRVSEFTALEPDAARYALHRGEKVFIGLKPAEGED